MFGELASGLVCVCVFVPHVASDAAARQTVMGVHKCACHSCAPHLTDGGLVRPLRPPLAPIPPNGVRIRVHRVQMLPRHVPRKDVGSRTRTACGLGGKLIRKFGKRSFLHYTATTTKKRVTTPPLGCIFIVMSQQSTTTCHLQHCAICDVGNACSTQFCASIIGSSFSVIFKGHLITGHRRRYNRVCVWCATFLPLAKLCTANRVPAHGKKR